MSLVNLKGSRKNLQMPIRLPLIKSTENLQAPIKLCLTNSTKSTQNLQVPIKLLLTNLIKVDKKLTNADKATLDKVNKNLINNNQAILNKLQRFNKKLTNVHVETATVDRLEQVEKNITKIDKGICDVLKFYR